MSGYDFRQLNDKEFEVLCADVLSVVTGCRVERFKPGRDLGVDGRYFSGDDGEVIIQCKHWENTPVTTLISSLELREKPKLERLRPKRYVLAVSNALSRVDKSKICAALHPYVVSESDVFGCEDINDVIRNNPEIERQNYKLWLQSASVLSCVINASIVGRSAYSIGEIARNSARYVVTSNHESALNQLSRLGVIIITGEPGIGKTTLAEHVCMYFVSEGYSYYKIDDDVREAESVYLTDSKQIFYFDDFLGRNYLDALRGREGSQIAQFIRRVSSSKNKKFVLTSRSTILSQGKLLMDALEHGNISRNEYELRILDLSEIDKARILYNHIWHSGLGREYVDQLYDNKRYRSIVAHRNFNPRLISYITDPYRLDQVAPDRYWDYVLGALSNPEQVWENPFVAQLDDYCRAIVVLVVYNGSSISESSLHEAYLRYLLLPENGNLSGRREFMTNMRLLVGSFLSRTVTQADVAVIDLFNPSIGDYVLNRYSRDASTIKNALRSLRTSKSVSALRGLQRFMAPPVVGANAVCEALLQVVVESGFDDVDDMYLSQLCSTYIDSLPSNGVVSDGFVRSVCFLCEGNGFYASDDLYEVVRWALEKEIVSPRLALDSLRNNLYRISTEREISSAFDLIGSIPDGQELRAETFSELTRHVVFVFSENIYEFVDVDSVYSCLEYGEYLRAERGVFRLVSDKLCELGAVCDDGDVRTIIGALDFASDLDDYFRNAYGEENRVSAPVERTTDEIDDLFDRG